MDPNSCPCGGNKALDGSVASLVLWRSILCASGAAQPGTGGADHPAMSCPAQPSSPEPVRHMDWLVNTAQHEPARASSSRPLTATHQGPRALISGPPRPVQTQCSQQLSRPSRQEPGTGYNPEPRVEILPPEGSPVLSRPVIILVAVWVAHCK